MRVSSGRAIAASSACVEAVAVRAELAEARGAAAEHLDPLADAVGLGAERLGQGRDLLGRAAAHRLHRHRQHRRVGLGVRRFADPDHRLAEHVMQRQPGRSSASAQSSAPRASSPRSRSPRAGSSASAISRPLAARPCGKPVGQRRVERVGAVRERVHRGRPQLGPRARSSSPSGSASTSAGRTRASPPGPAGSRWIAVISAPESVVGIAATSAAAHGGDRLRRVDHAAAAERDQAVDADALEDRRRDVGDRAAEGPGGYRGGVGPGASGSAPAR